MLQRRSTLDNNEKIRRNRQTEHLCELDKCLRIIATIQKSQMTTSWSSDARSRMVIRTSLHFSMLIRKKRTLLICRSSWERSLWLWKDKKREIPLTTTAEIAKIHSIVKGSTPKILKTPPRKIQLRLVLKKRKVTIKQW